MILMSFQVSLLVIFSAPEAKNQGLALLATELLYSILESFVLIEISYHVVLAYFSRQLANKDISEVELNSYLALWSIIFVMDLSLGAVLSIAYIFAFHIPVLSYAQNVVADATIASLLSTYFYVDLYRDEISRLISQRKDAELEKKKNEELILRSQLDANSLRINNHFLFNAFSVLSDLIQTNQDAAEHFLTCLTAYYRSIMKVGQKALVSVGEEMEMVYNYLQMCSYRYGDSIRFNVDGSLLSAYKERIVPLTLQHLVENAFKHNAFSEEKPLIISISREDSMVIVRNNIQAKRNSENRGGSGFSNIQEKYNLISNVYPTWRVEDNNFVVMVPLL